MMVSLRRRSSTRRLFLFAALFLLLALPSSSAAQDTLQQLQTTTWISVELQGATVLHYEDNGEVFTGSYKSPVLMSSYNAVGLSDGFNDASGGILSWDEEQFSMRYQSSGENGNSSLWSFEGKVSTDGQSVESLIAEGEISSCTDPRGCTTPTGHEQFNIELSGPIPLDGLEDISLFEQEWCLKYVLTGADIASAIRQINYSSSSQGLVQTLDYPNSDGDGSEELIIRFCATGATPAASPPPITGFVWQFSGSNVLMPEDKYGFNLVASYKDQIDGNLVSLYDADRLDPSNLIVEGERLSPDVPENDSELIVQVCDWESNWHLPESLAESESERSTSTGEAISSLEVRPHCDSPNYLEQFQTKHNWTVAPYYITPEQQIVFELGASNLTPSGWAYEMGTTALFFYPKGINSEQGLLPAPYDPNADGTNVILLDDTLQSWEEVTQVVQVVWQAPSGKLGDQIALGIYMVGSAGQRLIIYEYTLVSYEKGETPATPVAGPIDTDEQEPGPDLDQDLDLDQYLNSFLEDLFGLPAGFGGIGDIPGPEGLLDALSGVVAPAALIAMLSTLGYLGGSPPPSGEDTFPPPNSPQQLTLTDASGRKFSYQWNPEYGGYINPETGGMLDPSLWNEYNQNLEANQAFIAQQRKNMNKITPPTPRQEFQSALEMAHKMIARIPYRRGDPLQKQLDAIHNRVRTQGTSAQDIKSIRGIAHSAWGHNQDRQASIWQEQMDLDRQLGYVQTGLQVVATVGKITGSIAEGMLGGNGFVTGFLYGAAENWDKGAGSMVANGLISGGFGWAGDRLGNVSPTGILWNTVTGGLSGAAESAASDCYNTGKVDRDKMKWSAGLGMVGGALGAGAQKWLGGADLQPGPAIDLPSGKARVDVDAPSPRVGGRPEMLDIPASKAGLDLDAPAPKVAGRPKAPDVVHPSKTIPLSEQPPGVRKMFSNVEFGPDGKPYAQLDDVLSLQGSSTDMRSLKNAPPEVREAFNNTLRKEVYDPHDLELIDWVSKNVPEANGRPVRVDDFRTPGAGPDPSAINTDRDYRMLMQNENGDWIEVRKELWQDKSYQVFGKQTGFDGPAVQKAHPEVDWDQMTPEQQLAKQQELWADRHQQLGTDRASIEAGPDYSDQRVVAGQWEQVESNILKVKHGEATLQDADALGQMYYEKVAASLRRDNTPEAVAQAKKAVDSLWSVRHGYAMQKLPVGHLPNNLNQAMHIIKNAPVDHRVTAEAMAAMNQQLAILGFPDGVDQVAKAMSAQFSALRMAGVKS